ncbi:hypothetical protein FIM12_07840 [SAR202 cluster bacterium AD-804-J14_MRT_500m]|nr:hypothetical protein [SAR202 cluster bacterium AD-804-J14_MRT_500m]
MNKNLIKLTLFCVLFLSTVACGSEGQAVGSPAPAGKTSDTSATVGSPTPAAKIADTPAIEATTDPDEKPPTGELSISCTLNDAEQKVRCESNFGDQTSGRIWTSNASSRSSSGPDFEFVLEEDVDKITVTFEGCLNSSCQTTTSIIDNIGDKVQRREPGERASGFESTDFKGRNIFNLDFNEFPFSCNELDGNQLTTTFFPTDLITAIEPMGRTSPFNSHVTPTDHLYVHREYSAGNEYVLAPGDGYIVQVDRAREDSPLSITDDQGKFRGEQAKPLVPDYRVVMMHSCALFTIFIHLGELAPAVEEASGPVLRGKTWMAGYDREPLLLKAGDPIARYGSQNLDWSVHDANTVLEGFVAPDRYEDERFKIHTVDPFQFYREPARAALLDKMLRQAEPRAGKIDYDIEGRIIGNWFLEGTNDPLDAQTQLSIVYGYIDPTQLRISIGADMGIDDSLCGPCFGSYGVRGNEPDPANIGVGAGLVKYELMSRDEERAWVSERVGDTSLGAFLVQHLGDRRIRVEVIPGKSLEEVSGFSDKARTYRR